MTELRQDILDGVLLTAVLERGELAGLYARPEKPCGWPGDVYNASVRRYAPAQRAYFLDIGAEGEAMLPLNDAALLAPGAKITVQVERPATRDKQMRVSLLKQEADARPIGLIAKGPNDTTQALLDFPGAKAVPGGLESHDHAILSLCEPLVTVRDGISLVIERITALTAIDVNNADPSVTPLQVNRAVLPVLVRQWRLRNLNGQILVDFLRLRDPAHRKALEDDLADLVASDPCPVKLYGFTRLGLFELTRTKRGLPLAEVFALAARK